MHEKLLLKQVFTPGGQPSITYVGREHLGLEKRVTDALVRGYSINVVTGPTKSGKTVLCNHILGRAGESVSIEGGQVRSEQDFWEQIAYSLDLGKERVRREAGSANDNLEASAGVKALSFSAGVKGSKGNIRTAERSITYPVNQQRASLDYLLKKITFRCLLTIFITLIKIRKKELFRLLRARYLRGSLLYYWQCLIGLSIQ